MADTMSTEDRKRIDEGLQQKYAKVARSPEGNFRYPTGRAGLEGLKYDLQFIDRLSEDVQSSYCGVGNPFSLGPVNEGETLLDIGCGGGVDTMLAAMLVGPQGRAVGIDFIPEMLERARENVSRSGLTNVILEQGSGEALPFGDESFDVVISNGVFNLIPDKRRAAKEVFRVLRSGGRLMVADQVLTGAPPADTARMVDTWAG